MPTHIVRQDRRANEKDVHLISAQIFVLLTFCVTTQIYIYIQRLGELLEYKQIIFSLWVRVDAMLYKTRCLYSLLTAAEVKKTSFVFLLKTIRISPDLLFHIAKILLA
jgi:hypothetical protein